MTVNNKTELNQKADRAYSRKEVVEIIGSVMKSIDPSKEPQASLHGELQKLSDYISSMRTELAQLRTIGISHNDVPAASDELDAVVEETAAATGTIMDSCEIIEKIAEDVADNESADALSNAVTAIYEACSFQDITGQRITKVIKTLKNIEIKVDEIIHLFDEGKPQKTEDEDDSLLNGPQLKGGGSSQEEIDALLASFD